VTDPESPNRDLSAEGPAGPGLTLSEEELVINTELMESGRARLIKRVEVETVTRTFELRREVLEVERLDPLPDGQSGGAASPDDGPAGSAPDVLQSGPLAPGSLQEGVLEIVLMQEEALITTQLVPRERVRLTKHVVAEDHQVQADLSAERVDLEERGAAADTTTTAPNPQLP
jgi:stress response protein YsnF